MTSQTRQAEASRLLNQIRTVSFIHADACEWARVFRASVRALEDNEGITLDGLRQVNDAFRAFTPEVDDPSWNAHYLLSNELQNLIG